MPGVIQKVGFSATGLGNYVEMKNGDFVVIYGHLHTSIGTEGDMIKAGDTIGISGTTGRSTGEHLHLSIKYKGKTVNPLPIINFIQRFNKENDSQN